MSCCLRNVMVGTPDIENHSLFERDDADLSASSGQLADHPASSARSNNAEQMPTHVANTSTHYRLKACDAAKLFCNWLRDHDLIREWQVDEVWYLAESDFAVALGIELPPRRVFLGTLKKLPKVHVTQNRRVRNRAGRVVRKTTFYDFTRSLNSST